MSTYRRRRNLSVLNLGCLLLGSGWLPRSELCNFDGMLSGTCTDVVTPDGVGESTMPSGGDNDVDSAGAEFAMVSISCGATTFKSVGFNVWASIAYCLIMVGMELIMLCMLLLVILKKLVYKSTICLLNFY